MDLTAIKSRIKQGDMGVWEDIGYKPLERRVAEPDEKEYTVHPASEHLGYNPREISRPATKHENLDGLAAARKQLRRAS